MVIKPYEQPPLLQLLRSLAGRCEFSSEWRQQYQQLIKGHEGEEKFSILLQDLTNECLILHDLLLECNNTLFQIDTLLIFEKEIYLIEVKYYEGDYVFKSGNWYTLSQKEIHNPILQLNRCTSLLRRLLQKYGMHLPVREYALFNHSEFTLYHADPQLPIILPTQIKHFLNQLNRNKSKTSERHLQLAKKLLANHHENPPFQRQPEYSFEDLEKGIQCRECDSLFTFTQGRSLICNHCGMKKKLETAVLRSVKEFNLLFPKQKVTTAIIHEWCDAILSKKVVQRILHHNFKACGHGPHTYYVER